MKRARRMFYLKFMVEILLARPGACPVTRTLIEKALGGAKTNTPKNNDFSGILYLSPSNEKRREAQKLFHALIRVRGINGGYIPPRMFTPGQLAGKLLRESNLFPLPSWLRVPLIMGLSGGSAGHAANIASFMTEIRGHFPGKKAPDILDLLLQALAGLGIAEEVGERLGQTLGLMEFYDATLEKNGFLDPGCAAHEAAGLVEGLFPFPDALILDGFHELSASEKSLVRALIENAESGKQKSKTLASVPMTQKYAEITGDYLSFLQSFPHRETALTPEGGTETKTKNAGAPKYFACPTSEAEVEAAARRMKANYISGAFTDLSAAAVVVPSLDGYTDMIERVFVKYGVPYSFPAGAKRSMRARMEKDLLSVFDAVAAGREGRGPLGHESPGCEPSVLVSIMASPFFTNMPEELRGLAARITLSAESGGLNNRLEDNTGVEWLIKRLFPAKNKNGDAAHVLNGYLWALKALGFSAGGYEDEFEDRLNALSLLPEMCAGSAKKQKTKTGNGALREIVGLVASGIEEEMETPGVRVLGFAEAAELEPESLYFLGLKDGRMPARPENDFFLPERLRAALGLKTMKKTLLTEEFLFQRLISGPAFVHLSYPEMEADKIFLPSIFISDGEPMPEAVYGIFSKEEELVRKGGPAYSSNLKEIVNGTKKTARRPLPMNVTDVDSFRACARLFYLEKILGLCPAEGARYGLEPKTAGTLLHAAMEALMPLGAEDESPEHLAMRAGQAIDAALAQRQKQNRQNPAGDRVSAGDEVSPFWGRLLKETFLAALPGIREIEKKFRDEGFTRTAVLTEEKIEGELRGARLRGKIDRMDEDGEGMRRILDYKTGAATLNPEDVLRKGTSLQLFLYAALAETLGIGDVGSVGIYSLKDLKVKLVPGSADKKAGRTMRDYVEAALCHLEETLGAISRGDFRAAPSSEQNCRRCHEKPYCPFIHGGPSSQPVIQQ